MIENHTDPDIMEAPMDVDPPDLAAASIPDDVIEAIEDWEFPLNLLESGDPQRLKHILETAPNPGSASAQFLMEYLASYAPQSN